MIKGDLLFSKTNFSWRVYKLMTKDKKAYDIICDKEEDILGNIRLLCGECKMEIGLVMSIIYNREHTESRVERCPHCRKLNLVWDKSYIYT